jgi:hypothetical protein
MTEQGQELNVEGKGESKHIKTFCLVFVVDCRLHRASLTLTCFLCSRRRSLNRVQHAIVLLTWSDSSDCLPQCVLLEDSKVLLFSKGSRKRSYCLGSGHGRTMTNGGNEKYNYR